MATDLTGLSGHIRIIAKMVALKALDKSVPADDLSYSKQVTYTYGTGANRVNQIWHDQRPLAGGAGEELDFAGSLLNAFGGSVTFANIKAIIVENASTNSGTTITIGNASANQFVGPFGAAAHTLTIKPGGFAAVCDVAADGWTVTANSGDKFKILNNDASNTATYNIIVIGES